MAEAPIPTFWAQLAVAVHTDPLLLGFLPRDDRRDAMATDRRAWVPACTLLRGTGGRSKGL